MPETCMHARTHTHADNCVCMCLIVLHVSCKSACVWSWVRDELQVWPGTLHVFPPIQMASLQAWAGVQGVLLPSHPAIAEGRLDRAVRLPCNVDFQTNKSLPVKKKRDREWSWTPLCSVYVMKHVYVYYDLLLNNPSLPLSRTHISIVFLNCSIFSLLVCLFRFLSFFLKSAFEKIARS